MTSDNDNLPEDVAYAIKFLEKETKRLEEANAFYENALQNGTGIVDESELNVLLENIETAAYRTLLAYENAQKTAADYE